MSISETTTSEVDVLIIGAGPAGLMLGCWLARTGVKTRIIEQRDRKITCGHADGVQCRTIEVFQSFGFAERFAKEANELCETVFYNPNENGLLVPTERIPDTEPDISRFRHGVLNQGRIEDFLIDCMAEHGLKVERSVAAREFRFNDDDLEATHPVEVTVAHLVPAEPDEVVYAAMAKRTVSRMERIKARYVVGCDGARSWTRKQLGYKLEGDSANIFWGVIDARPITDLPDIRVKVVLHSAESGSLLVVPRERNIVRFYVQLGKLEVGQKLDPSMQTLEAVIASARKIMAPYTLECPVVEWWSVYEIGQRLCRDVSFKNRVFLAGDAFHTHSPKAGQGMNFSMMDSYNLGWKLAACIKGTMDPKILETYASERVEAVSRLLDFDRDLAHLFSGKPAVAERAGVSMKEFQALWMRMAKWTSGTGIEYGPSMLVAEGSEAKKALAGNILIGSHFESRVVLRYADAKGVHFADSLVSDGRWRLICFAGDMRDPTQFQRLERLCADLTSLPTSPIKRYTPPNADINSFIQLLTLTSSPRKALLYTSFPELTRPFVSVDGHHYPTYDQLFSDEPSYLDGGGGAYAWYGVDPSGPGCVVLVRPDQHVVDVMSFEECVQTLGRFFDAIMVQEST
ncbi:3-(3-hydroxy-phenyl)propionate hydroxylase [Mycena chlorophos]|uniref:3-(3-hydroxy-phenyl)propionate hydroxylase n=1 Tax=Mycena chlorophos TaxID=658473 RepID=A0A8H6STU8_MYCCL|nr:3-(3-hydroxy-phenyl)propionate hydroxylase [Mycena chlorophos]